MQLDVKYKLDGNKQVPTHNRVHIKKEERRIPEHSPSGPSLAEVWRNLLSTCELSQALPSAKINITYTH